MAAETKDVKYTLPQTGVNVELIDSEVVELDEENDNYGLKVELGLGEELYNLKNMASSVDEYRGVPSDNVKASIRRNEGDKYENTLALVVDSEDMPGKAVFEYLDQFDSRVAESRDKFKSRNEAVSALADEVEGVDQFTDLEYVADEYLSQSDIDVDIFYDGDDVFRYEFDSPVYDREDIGPSDIEDLAPEGVEATLLDVKRMDVVVDTESNSEMAEIVYDHLDAIDDAFSTLDNDSTSRSEALALFNMTINHENSTDIIKVI